MVHANVSTQILGCMGYTGAREILWRTNNYQLVRCETSGHQTRVGASSCLYGDVISVFDNVNDTIAKDKIEFDPRIRLHELF